MIRNFKHKGLERYFISGRAEAIQPRQAKRIGLILARLHASTSPPDMGLPGLNLHELKGRRKGIWAVRVSGNWRITFRFEGPDAHEVNLEDYH